MLLAFNLPPSATYFNQVASLLGWGAWMSHPTSSSSRTPALHKDVAAYVTLGLLIVVVGLPSVLDAQPWALALSAAALVASAALVVALGNVASRNGLGSSMFLALCVAFLIAGLASCVIGIIQVYLPTWADGDLIARSSVVGRSVGNLRQPNHLCSLLLWSIVAALWLGEAQFLRRALAIVFAGLMLFVVVLSGSRSGGLGALLLAFWGLLDRRRARSTRVALLLAPLAYGFFWIGATAWAPRGAHAFGGAGRFSATGDISSSRFGIWSNTLDLIRTHPWFGVGFGEFNFAWTLTEFPNRPVAFFDHTHNLPLQLAVELGLALAALVLATLGWALWRAARNCMLPPDPDEVASPQRAAFVMVLLVLMHSLLEYPLWYAYFLLPTAFLLGLCVAGPTRCVVAAAPAPHVQVQAMSVRIASLVLMLGAAYSIYDYFKVVVIFAPPDNASPLAERIAA
ncbi:MAG: Wzy polymerase domain-containing protein, partial [Burkholderiaceae bacterium]